MKYNKLQQSASLFALSQTPLISAKLDDFLRDTLRLNTQMVPKTSLRTLPYSPLPQKNAARLCEFLRETLRLNTQMVTKTPLCALPYSPHPQKNSARLYDFLRETLRLNTQMVTKTLCVLCRTR